MKSLCGKFSLYLCLSQAHNKLCSTSIICLVWTLRFTLVVAFYICHLQLEIISRHSALLHIFVPVGCLRKQDKYWAKANSIKRLHEHYLVEIKQGRMINNISYGCEGWVHWLYCHKLQIYVPRSKEMHCQIPGERKVWVFNIYVLAHCLFYNTK